MFLVVYYLMPVLSLSLSRLWIFLQGPGLVEDSRARAQDEVSKARPGPADISYPLTLLDITMPT